MAEKTKTQRANGITKQQAVELALQEKGWDARPVDLKPYIKERFGLDMTAEHITTCKSKARKGKKKPAPKAPGKPASQQSAKASAPRAGNARSDGFSLEDLQAVKSLIGRVGAVKLRTLIDLLA
jgi:hypothetical protein